MLKKTRKLIICSCMLMLALSMSSFAEDRQYRADADTVTVSAVQTEDCFNPIGTVYSEDELTHSKLSDTEAYDILMQIKNEYPEGSSWDDSREYISGIRCGYGCAAFVFMVQDRLYGTPARPAQTAGADVDSLHVGDHLRLDNNTHSVIVLSIGQDAVTVAEGNYNGCVHWGRSISFEELKRELSYRESCI